MVVVMVGGEPVVGGDGGSGRLITELEPFAPFLSPAANKRKTNR